MPLTPLQLTFFHASSRRARRLIGLLTAILIVGILLALSVGSESVSLVQIVRRTLSPEQAVIIWHLRLPRIALALGVGGALALAGAAFQSLLRNPLADPYVLGISSGAALGAIFGILFAAHLPFARPLLSFAGAALATGMVYSLGRRESDPARLILAGVVISTMLASLMILLTALADDLRLRNITFWLLGDLSHGSHELLAFLGGSLVLGAAILISQARALNLMMMGERDAFALGVETGRVRWIVFLTASLLTAAAVATGGAIGYVGLVVPHLIRLVTGADNRIVLPAGALTGALLVLLADTTARTVIAPRELPTGAITALIGAPILVYLLLGGSRQKWKQFSLPSHQDFKARPSNTPPASILRSAPPNLAAAPLLAWHNIHFGYADEILTDVSLELHAGEVLALLGQNGAGKSTLLHLATGKLHPQTGKVTLQQKNLSEFPRREIARRLAFVAQTGELQFPLTVLEFVLAGRFAHTAGIGFEPQQDLDLAAQALAATNATQFAARFFNELSSGEKQRVVLARALAQQPQILLLDEPTANLDVAHQIALLRLVQKLAHEYQFAVLLVTHEINLAATFADRVALLQQGKILACGTSADVLTTENLSTVFEAEVALFRDPETTRPPRLQIGKTQ